MIITLKGADFSTNNINDLIKNWSISIAGGGLTHNCPSSVEKGAALESFTITVDTSKYTFDGGVTVTMSGSAVANAFTVSGNVITINRIAEVTGKVEITVGTTKNTAGGGEEEPETPVTPTSYTFTINPDPTSATVTLSATGYSTVSGTGNQSITVANGTTVNWSVSADGYTTRTGNWTISGGNKTENIALSASGGGGIINYFNPDDPDINETEYMDPNGAMIPGSGTLGWSGYIACSPGETYYAYYNKSGTYTKYPDSMVTFFNSSKERVSGMKDDDYIVPEGAAYFRAPFSIARRYNDFMFIKSPNVPTEFIPYNAG
jgi:hypothetical protein